MPGGSKKGGGLLTNSSPYKMKGFSYPGISPVKSAAAAAAVTNAVSGATKASKKWAVSDYLNKQRGFRDADKKDAPLKNMSILTAGATSMSGAGGGRMGLYGVIPNIMSTFGGAKVKGGRGGYGGRWDQTRDSRGFAPHEQGWWNSAKKDTQRSRAMGSRGLSQGGYGQHMSRARADWRGQNMSDKGYRGITSGTYELA